MRERQDQFQQQVVHAQAQGTVQQPVVELHVVTEHDVVVAGATSNWWTENPGNIAFRSLLSANQKLFQTWPEKTRLKHISLSIVATFRDRKGRFLQKYEDPESPLKVSSSGANVSTSDDADNRGHEAIWCDIGDSKAIKWTSELLNRMFQKSEMIKAQKAPIAPSVAASTTKNTKEVTSSTAVCINNKDQIVPKPSDVLWARGLSQHPGNLTYRKMVLASMQDQSVLSWNEIKLKAVSRSIVTTIKVECNGRFLKNVKEQSTTVDNKNVASKNNTQMVWCEISTEDAFEKTVSALNEAREKLLRHVAVKEKEQNRNSRQNSEQEDVEEIGVNLKKNPNVVAKQPPNVVEPVVQRPQMVASPGETDVVFGAGPGTEALKHPGNQVYRSLVSCNTRRYRSCESKEKKLRICQSIVAAIKGQEGRFLKLNRTTELWQVIPDSKTIEVTAAILQRVDKNTKKHDANASMHQQQQQQQQGTKSKPIDIIDEDEDNTETTAPAIKPPTVKNPIKRKNTTAISKNNDKKKNSKKKCTNMMVQELYKLQKKKAPGLNVTGDEYRAIETAMKKKAGLENDVYVSKKLVQDTASEMRRAAKRVEVVNREESSKDENVDDADYSSDDSLVF